MHNYQGRSPRVLVVGDVMVDHYLWGKTERISPEAPVPVVDVQKESEALGGCGNVINNLVTLGAKVCLASVIGNDENGRNLKALLQDADVDTGALVIEPSRRTTKKSRVIAAHQQVVRFDSESRQEITKETETQILSLVTSELEDSDIVLISDYGKGVITETLCREIITRCRAAGKKILVDPKGRDYNKYRNATLVTPNRKEAGEATGIKIVDDQSLQDAGFKLKNTLNLDWSMITLSEDGMAIFDKTMRTIPTAAREVYDVTGAGDTVLAMLGFVLACGGKIDDAARIANCAAAVVVGKLGSATAGWAEIIAYEEEQGISETDERIMNFEKVRTFAKAQHHAGKKVVFTNGCFDILHLGHATYLEKAKSFGDVLIVGVNSDDSVRKLKGSGRPVNPEYDRAYLLAAQRSVDAVVIFHEATPYDLVKLVAPDILVKGGDYAGKEVVGSDIAGEVRLVDFVQGKSTSNVINKINVKENQC